MADKYKTGTTVGLLDVLRNGPTKVTLVEDGTGSFLIFGRGAPCSGTRLTDESNAEGVVLSLAEAEALQHYASTTQSLEDAKSHQNEAYGRLESVRERRKGK